MSYIGNSPGIGQGQTFFYTLGAGATSVSGADANGRTLSYTPGLFMIVSLNGTVLNPTEYTATNGTTISFVGWTAAAGDELFVYAFGAFALADMVRLSLGLNDLPDKDAALLNLGLTANGRSLVKAANYSAMLDLFGFSAFFKTLIDDADAATLRASLGVNPVDLASFTTVGANTWTKPSWATANSLVVVVARGGGGGGGNGSATTNGVFGGVGGGGAAVLGLYAASELGATESVSVGSGGAAASAGGNSTFRTITAGGGGGGTNASGATSGTAGAGGVASGGIGLANGNGGAAGGGGGGGGGAGGSAGVGIGGAGGAGTVPSGGGGAGSGSGTGPGGAGARGEVRVWTIG